MALNVSHQLLRIEPVLAAGISAIPSWRILGGLYLIPFCLAVFSMASSAQSPADSLKTFTAPDGGFSLGYSSQLIACQLRHQVDGEAYSWTPAENCSAYFPTCDGETGPDYTAIACFAYPRNKFTKTESFEAATFSVEMFDHIATEKDCLAGPPDEIFRRQKDVIIHGVSFAVFEFGEAGMSQGVSGDVYRTFHRGKCYQLGINLATANAQTFDPPATEFTKEDWREVQGKLKRALNSFRFLK